jgi:hypothetical protein
VREGTNVRQSFDAVRLIVRGPQRRAGVTSAAGAPTCWPAPSHRPARERSTTRRTRTAGVGPLRERPGAAGLAADATLDVYYLGHARDRARFAQGTGAERRHTAGVRLAGVRALGAATFGWDWEPMLQWGRFAPLADATSGPAPAPGASAPGPSRRRRAGTGRTRRSRRSWPSAPTWRAATAIRATPTCRRSTRSIRAATTSASSLPSDRPTSSTCIREWSCRPATRSR